MPDQNPLSELRQNIDRIDEQIITLLNQRLSYAIEIGKIKAQSGQSVFDSARESTLISRLMDINQGPLPKSALYQIYTEIMAASREIQNPMRISYLGPQATFTHLAAMKHFGHSATLVAQTNIGDVFREVEKGTCHYGVVPIENSIEGAVNHTLDLFYESDLMICAEIFQAVSHDLLSISGIKNEIEVIYSHPQAFSQCRQWLENYLPEASLIECSSTAVAAQKASSQKNAAAIAGKEAAHIYNLQIVASKIEDISRNITRFLVIGRQPVKRTGRDKTSLMFVTSHKPGALYRILQPIGESGINMVKLESRPSRFENWSYMFFVDLEGHIDSEKIRQTVDKMKQICLHLKILGSYPSAMEEIS